MHLEDFTTLPLNIITQRLSAMASYLHKYLPDLGEQVAAQSVGQLVIHKAEDALWAVEKSIEWSAPSEPKKAVKPDADVNEMNGSQQKEPVPEGRPPSRPLPWIFFIPVLVVWRGTRLVYETASSLLGKPPIHPEDVVVFLRNRRRGLRALRIRGKRTMKTTVGSPTILSKMTSFANPLIVVLNKMLGLVGLAPRKESKRDLEVSSTTRPPLAGEVEDDANENVLEKLNRLSGDPDNIEDDPDFEPDSSVSSDASSSSGADASEDDHEQVSTPVVDVVVVAAVEDARPPPRTSSFIADIIVEEDEETEVTDLDSPSPSSQGTKLADTDDADDDDDDDVSEDADFASASSARSSDVFTDTCDSQNSAMQQISTVFKKGLVTQNSF